MIDYQTRDATRHSIPSLTRGNVSGYSYYSPTALYPVILNTVETGNTLHPVSMETRQELERVLHWRQGTLSPDNQDTIYDTSFIFQIFCFIFTTLFAFTFSLSLFLLCLECYKHLLPSTLVCTGCRNLREQLSPPPAYDSVLQADQLLLPSYAQACSNCTTIVWLSQYKNINYHSFIYHQLKYRTICKYLYQILPSSAPSLIPAKYGWYSRYII